MAKVKISAFGSALAAAFIIGLVLVLGTGTERRVTFENVTPIPQCGLSGSPKFELQSQGFDVISIAPIVNGTSEAGDPTVSGARGSTITVPFKVCYLVGINSSGSNVTIQYQGLQTSGYMLPGNQEIDVNSTSVFDPQIVKDLHPKEVRTILMHISIPRNWPDQIIGQSYPLQPNFEIIGSKANVSAINDEFYRNTGRLPIEILPHDMYLRVTG